MKRHQIIRLPSAVALYLSICAIAFVGGCSGTADRPRDPAVVVPAAKTLPQGAQAAAEFDSEGLVEGAGASFFVPLTDPAFVSAGEATFLGATDIVLGVSDRGEHRAYPVRQISFHHIINDEIRGQPYLITY